MGETPLENTSLSLDERRTYYTVPWALHKDTEGQFWLRLDYASHAAPFGTARLEVCVESREDITCHLLPGDPWTWEADDVSRWKRHGLIVKVRLVR